MTLDRIQFDGDGFTARASAFRPAGRARADEMHVCIRPGDANNLEQEVEILERAYDHILRETGFLHNEAVLRRFFVSDASNQRRLLARSALADESNGTALSVIEQPPVDAHRLCFWAYHVRGEQTRSRRGPTVAMERNGRTHLWTTGLGHDSGQAYEQTQGLFDDYLEQLASFDCTLEDNVVRTWLFVRDVDRKYAGLVRARKELFEEHGLNASTHYIASTGIEGRHEDPNRLVTMDAYAVGGLDAAQLKYLQALDHLGPTSDYGVTFERGTRVRYGDRSHLFISGTASIDPAGTTLHERDVKKQLTRAADNVEALLRDGGAGPNDITQMIVYMRDSSDRTGIEAMVQERWPAVPVVVVHAPVCRPGWLVEIECIAVTDEGDERWSGF